MHGRLGVLQIVQHITAIYIALHHLRITPMASE